MSEGIVHEIIFLFGNVRELLQYFGDWSRRNGECWKYPVKLLLLLSCTNRISVIISNDCKNTLQ